MAVCDKLYQCVAFGFSSRNLDTFLIHAVLLQAITVTLKIDDCFQDHPVQKPRKRWKCPLLRTTDILYTRYVLDVLTFRTWFRRSWNRSRHLTSENSENTNQDFFVECKAPKVQASPNTAYDHSKPTWRFRFSLLGSNIEFVQRCKSAADLAFSISLV